MVGEHELDSGILLRENILDEKMHRSSSPTRMNIALILNSLILTAFFLIFWVLSYFTFGFVIILIMVLNFMIIWAVMTYNQREGSKYGSEILVNSVFLSYEKYDSELDTFSHNKCNIYLNEISAIEVERPRSNCQDNDSGPVAWKLVIYSYFRGRVMLYRYPELIIKAANDIHSLKIRMSVYEKQSQIPTQLMKQKGESTSPQQIRNSSAIVTQSTMRQTPIKTLKNDIGDDHLATDDSSIKELFVDENKGDGRWIAIVAICFFASAWVYFAIHTWFLLFLGTFYIIPILLFTRLLIEDYYWSPERIEVDKNGIKTTSKKQRIRTISWCELAGVQEPWPDARFCYILTDKGVPILIGVEAANSIKENYRKVSGHYPPVYVFGRWKSNAWVLRKNLKNKNRYF